MKKTNNLAYKDSLLLLGIGIFGWSAISSLSLLFEKTFKDIILSFDLNHISIEVFPLGIKILIFILGIYILIKVTKTNNILSKKVFLTSAIIYLTSLLLHVIQPVINNLYSSKDYLNNYNIHQEYLLNHIEYSIINYTVTSVMWIVIFILIYKNQK